MTIRIHVTGIDEAFHKLDAKNKGPILRKAFHTAGVIVEGAARTNVHKITRKLAQSLDVRMTGSGMTTAAHIGPLRQMPGARGFSKNMTSQEAFHKWKRPHKGVNSGDPRIYGKFEEEGTDYRAGHPFLVPALTDNIGRIKAVISSAIASFFP